MLLEALRQMQARGMDRVCVSTGVANMPAIRLYESLGFKRVNSYLDYAQVDWEPVGPTSSAVCRSISSLRHTA